MLKNCLWCGIEFNAVKSRIKFCSRKCFHCWRSNKLANRKKVIVGGYIRVYRPSHPKVAKSGYIGEHILVMEASLSRHLKANEMVHHKDNNPSNNYINNLQLMTIKEHKQYHANLQKDRVTFKCIWCGKLKTLKRSKGSIRKFCSKSCKGKWQWYTNHISNSFKRTAKLK